MWMEHWRAIGNIESAASVRRAAAGAQLAIAATMNIFCCLAKVSVRQSEVCSVLHFVLHYNNTNNCPRTIISPISSAGD